MTSAGSFLKSGRLFFMATKTLILAFLSWLLFIHVYIYILLAKQSKKGRPVGLSNCSKKVHAFLPFWTELLPRFTSTKKFQHYDISMS